MTKIAQLHNGTQIHFPDETPEHEMDAAVQRHLGVTSFVQHSVPEAVMAINNLSATIREIGMMMVSAMHAPKEIYKDETGAPKGFAIRQNSR